MRTVFHFTPARGWLNDPNGLIEHRGVHHFFFQHNPDELAMRDMCWGHASSTDLLTWVEHPIALRPGPVGSYDDDGCWSGCAVHDGTGVVAVWSAHHQGIELPSIARAVDDDLVVWEKSADNPVIDHRPAVPGMTDMRDHSVRWDGERWRQVLAGGAAGEGMLVGYSSTDLTHWDWDGIVLRAGDAGLPGRVWECPDVFEVGAEVVAITSLIDDDRSPVVWATGTLDGARMTPLQWGLVDHGDRLYAPQSYRDSSGRRLMFGWLRTHLDPAALGQPSLGVASLPRVLSFVDGRLHQEPAAELRRLREEPQVLATAAGATVAATDLDDRAAVEVRVECASAAELLATELDLDDGVHTMTVRLACFAEPDGLPDDGHREPPRPGRRAATVLFDSGIVETFLDDGRAAATTAAAVGAVRHLRVRWAAGGAGEVTVWPLRAPAPAGGTATRPRATVAVGT